MKKCTDTRRSPIDTACAMAFLPFTIKNEKSTIENIPNALNREIQKIYSRQQTKICLSILKNFYFLFEIDIIKIWKNGVLLKKFNAFRTKSII